MAWYDLNMQPERKTGDRQQILPDDHMEQARVSRSIDRQERTADFFHICLAGMNVTQSRDMRAGRTRIMPVSCGTDNNRIVVWLRVS